MLISTNYFELRADFLAHAKKRGADLTSIPIRARGPGGEELFIDFVWLGSASPSDVLVHIIGTHGVEGYAGSALQTRLLESDFAVPPGSAVLFVHGLNPWGMAHRRRVNESNVDLNRNFLAQPDAFVGAPEGYRLVQNFLNPQGMPWRVDLFYVQAVFNVLRYGFATLKQAIAGGQYEFDRGIYYGGKQLEEETQILRRFVADRLSGAKRVFAIEVHSGLGDWAKDELFWALPLEHPKSKWFAQQTGEVLASDSPQAGVGFRTPGDLQNEIPKILPDVDFYWVLQEFGAYGPIRTLKTLRDENRYYQSGGKDLDHWSKKLLLESFCPGAQDWQDRVISRGQEFFGRVRALLGARPLNS